MAEIKEVSSEKLQTVLQFYSELDELEVTASDAIKAAQLNNENEVIITRKDKGTQKVSEKLLWDEVFYLGPDSEAGKYLKKKYPDVFEKSEAHNRKAAELNEYTLLHLGMSSKGITIRDIIRLVEGIVKLTVGERK